MSLTGLLNDSNGPVRSFFRDRLGNLAGPREVWNAAGSITMPSLTERAWTGPVGAAVDYRVRFMFESPDPDHLMAAAGANLLAEHLGDSLRRIVPASDADGIPPSATLLSWIDGENLSYLEATDAAACDFYQPVSKLLMDLLPEPGGAPNGHHDRELASVCLLLALFEQCYRSRRVAQNELARLAPGSTIEQLMAIVPDTAVDDVVGLSGAFAQTCSDLLTLPAVCNPIFAQARRVNGADGDIILGQTLIDIKTSARPGLEPKDLYQLIGYVLLNDPEQYDIDSVAVYSARRPALVSWPLDDLLMDLAGTPTTIEDLRAPFFEAVEQSRVRHRS